MNPFFTGFRSLGLKVNLWNLQQKMSMKAWGVTP
jgi:hypothetical protein